MKISNCKLFLLISFFSGSIFAKEISTDTLRSKMTVGIDIMSGFSYRQLSVDTSVNLMTNYEGSRESLELWKPSFQIGVNFRHEINRFFSIKTGINYSENGYKVKQRIWFESNCIMNSGLADVNYHIRYLGIPLVAEFSKNYNKVRFYGDFGFSVDYLVQNTIESDVVYDSYLGWGDVKIISDRKDEYVCWYPSIWTLRESKFNLSGIVSLGVAIKLSNQFSLSIAPKFNYSFFSIYEKPIKENIYSLGLNYGFNYSF